jgi:CrcB protein
MIVWSLAETRGLISVHARAIILVGFMGAFTTFSTFAFETSQLVHRHELLAAGANILLSNLLGIVLVFVGLALGRLV